MQVISSERLTLADLAFTAMGPKDAPAMVKLYDAVYGGKYPCPELFTVEGMAAFLDTGHSHAITVAFSHGEDLVGSLTCEIKGRAGYVRGGMVSPEWQGRVSAKAAMHHILRGWRESLKGQVDYFYAEVRSETAKFQAIFDDLGWRPVVLLPRKDCFPAGREGEVIYAWHYRSRANYRLRLTPRAAHVASAVLQQRVTPVRAYVPSTPDSPEGQPVIHYDWEPNGDGHVHIALHGGATLDALVCIASLNTEKVTIHAADIGDYAALVKLYLAEIHAHGIEYAEVYAPADAPARQKVLEDLGFAPTGFLLDWCAPGSPRLGHHVVYTIHFPSYLPDCPLSLTPTSAYLQEFLSAPTVDTRDLETRLVEKGLIYQA